MRPAHLVFFAPMKATGTPLSAPDATVSHFRDRVSPLGPATTVRGHAPAGRGARPCLLEPVARSDEWHLLPTLLRLAPVNHLWVRSQATPVAFIEQKVSESLLRPSMHGRRTRWIASHRPAVEMLLPPAHRASRRSLSNNLTRHNPSKSRFQVGIVPHIDLSFSVMAGTVSVDLWPRPVDGARDSQDRAVREEPQLETTVRTI